MNCLSIGTEDTARRSQKKKPKNQCDSGHMAARDVGYWQKKEKKKITHVADQVFNRTVLWRQNMIGCNASVLSVAGCFFHPSHFGTGWLYYT